MPPAPPRPRPPLTRALLWLGLAALPLALPAQTSSPAPLPDPTADILGTHAPAPPPLRATVVRTEAAPILDGILDEPFWAESQPATGFWENFPSDSVRAAYQTEIRFAADGVNLYVGATCYAPGDEYVVSSLRRDFRAGGNDNLTLVFDPFRGNRNALVFGINPYGVNREALISNGGEDRGDFQEAWDNKWRGEAKVFEDRWTSELAIPLRSLRYGAADSIWYFNAYRFDTQTNTQTTWQRIPRNQIIMSLAYMGELTWEEPPGKAGGAATLIPYVSGAALRDREGEPDGTWGLDASAGGDAKIAVSSGLNLDLTVNPDFSQVEVDRQVINLTRFEVNFPERRQFFLENADLFGSFGIERINPFFSRRIGIARDTATGEAIANTIYYGARLSGQVGEDWRVGLLNMQTAPERANGRPGYTYTVAAAQRRVGARSSVGVISVNKDNLTDYRDTTGVNLDHNRVLGVDYNLATRDNRWTGKAFAHASVSPHLGADERLAPGDGRDVGVTHGMRLLRQSRHLDLGADYFFVGQDYRAEVGFVPRQNFLTFKPEAAYRFFPTRGPLAQHGPVFETRFYFDAALTQFTDQRAGLGYNWRWRRTQTLLATARYNMILLAEPFDPSGTDAVPLPGERRYAWLSAELEYRSDRRRAVSYEAKAELGEFYNGYQYGLDAEVVYRFQPYGNFGVNAVYSYVDLPAPYASTGLLLLGPRLDVTFTKALFLTTIAQYNDQLDNLNLNVRFQWRYAPVSDFFLVYTDNVDTRFGGSRNRSVVAKLTYWLNL